MKKTYISIALIITGIFALTGCPGDGGANTTNANRMTANTNAATVNTGNMTANTNASNTAVVQENFWTNAAESGLAEVELGKLASEKAQNADVRKFGQMMVADHSKANAELRALASKNSVTLTNELSPRHKEMMERLQGLSGAEFDRAYVDSQVEDHEETLELMENNSDNSNADIKAFAAKTQPIIKSHLDMIRNIQSKMK